MKAGNAVAHASSRQAELAEAVEVRVQTAAAQAYARGVEDGGAAEAQESAAAVVRAADALQQIADDTARLVGRAGRRHRGRVADRRPRTDPVGAALRTVPGLAVAAGPALLRGTHPRRPRRRCSVRVSGADIDAVRGWARTGVEVVADARLAPGEARLDRGEGSAVLTSSAALRRAAETFGFDPGILTPLPSGPPA